MTGRAYSPAAAAELANTTANTYFERDLKLNNRATRQAREYAEEKMVVAEKQLAQANVQLSRFKRATGLFSPDVQLTKNAEQMAELLGEYTPQSREVKQIEERIKHEEESLRKVAETVINSTVHSRNPVRDQAVVEQTSGPPTLSLVPKSTEYPPHLLGAEGHNLALVESFRILRNNISFANVKQQIKLLAITSPGRGEGKSTTLLNLGVAMAMEGKRVLLVDGDMRRPSLHRFVGVPRSAGLTTVLTGGSTLEETIVPTREKNVFCLPSGPTPPNPAEILNSRPCRELFKRLSEQYDLVLLVVSMDQTLKPQLDMAIRTLNQADAPLIGMVLNRMDVQGRRYGYYYYSSYHDYASDEDTSEAGSAETRSGRGP